MTWQYSGPVGRFRHYNNDPQQHFETFPYEYYWIVSNGDDDSFTVLARKEPEEDEQLLKHLVEALNQ